ncbi:MAG TPA: hypothetical protein VI758_02090 [Bacteroidota bacterium]
MEKTYRVWIQATWTVVVASLIGSISMMVMRMQGIPWQEHWFFLFFSIPLLLFGLILLPLLYHFRKKFMKGVQELVNGKHLAHWHYDPEEWNHFVEEEWSRTKTKAVWMPFSIVAGVIVLGYLFKGWGVEEFKVMLPWIFGLATIVALLMYSFGLRTHRKGLGKVGEVFIGEKAVQFNGTYYSWDAFGMKLGKVELLNGQPAVLQFEIQSLGRYGTNTSDVRVPVPRHHEKEAEAIVAKLSV